MLAVNLKVQKILQLETHIQRFFGLAKVTAVRSTLVQISWATSKELFEL